MDSVEMYQIYMEYIHAINGLWQIWLTSTFAFIVAFHVGRDSLTNVLTWIGCGLYSAASAALIMRYLIYIDSMRIWLDMVTEQGSIHLTDPGYATGVAALTTGTLIIGTLVAVGYAVYQYRESKDT